MDDGAGTREPVSGRRALPPRASVALLVLVTVLVFANALPGGFHLDDHFRVVQNPEITRFWPPWRHLLDPSTSSSLPSIVQYRPLLPLTLSIDHALFGMDARAFHATNLLLHLGAVLLVLLLARELLRQAAPPGLEAGPARERLALAAALLYAVHPVAGVPVEYVCARDLLLMQVCLLGSFVVYLRLRRLGDTPWRWAATLGLMALSLLGKTNAVALPALVLASELLLRGARLTAARTWARVLPFALVAIAFFAWTRGVLGFSDADQLVVSHGAFWNWPLTEAKVHLFHYLRDVVWPLWLHPLPAVAWVDSPADPRAWLGVAVIVGSLVLAFRWRRRRPLAALAIVAWWILLAPTSSFVPLRSAAADYRPVPSLPWMALLLVLVGRRLLPARVRIPALGLAVLGLGGVAISNNAIWQTERGLWEHSVALGGTAVARLNLARTLMEDDPGRARALLHEALEEIPDYIRAYLMLGLIDIRQGDPDAGCARLQYAVDLDPDLAESRYWQAVGLADAGRSERAAEVARTAARMDPDQPRFADAADRFAWLAALAAQGEGRDDDALEWLAGLHAHRSAFLNSRFVEAWSRYRLGDLEGAVTAYEQHLRERPDDVQATFNLAYTLMELGRWDEAVTRFRDVLALDPDLAPAHLHLASCLGALGRTEEAAREQERAEQLGADEAPAADDDGAP